MSNRKPRSFATQQTIDGLKQLFKLVADEWITDADCPVPPAERVNTMVSALLSTGANVAMSAGFTPERVAALFDEAARQVRSGEARAAQQMLQGKGGQA